MGKKVKVLDNSVSNTDLDEWFDMGKEPISQPGYLSVSQSVSLFVWTADPVLSFSNSDPRYAD